MQVENSGMEKKVLADQGYYYDHEEEEEPEEVEELEEERHDDWEKFSHYFPDFFDRATLELDLESYERLVRWMHNRVFAGHEE